MDTDEFNTAWKESSARAMQAIQHALKIGTLTEAKVARLLLPLVDTDPRAAEALQHFCETWHIVEGTAELVKATGDEAWRDVGHRMVTKQIKALAVTLARAKVDAEKLA